jgi:hypothetical protein
MQKLISILFITSLINVSHASYLDDWSNDDLCGWMESSSTPKNILDEVDKREILCYGGIEVSTLPESDSSEGENGTVFPSPDPSLIPEAIPDKKKSMVNY